MENETFDFVVSTKWTNGAMSIYTYGSQIQNGTMKGAENFLEYVKRQSPEDGWKIYKVNFEEVK